MPKRPPSPIGTWMAVCFFVACLCVGASIFVQYTKHVEPCNLCLLQRAIWIGVVIFSGLWALIRSRILQYGAVLFLLSGFSVSSYHSMVQAGILSDQCSAQTEVASLEDFELMLENSKEGCSRADPLFFGLPLAAYSAVASLACLLLQTLRRRRVSKQSD